MRRLSIILGLALLAIGLMGQAYSPASMSLTAWTPTLASTSGTIGTYTLNNAGYAVNGNFVYFVLDFTMTSAGTGSGQVTTTLPVPTVGTYFSGTCTGAEVASGALETGRVNSTGAIVFFVSGTYIGANGDHNVFSCSYLN